MSGAATDVVAGETPRKDGPVGATGMWTFLATDAMGFGGLFIAYAALRVRADAWPDPAARLSLAPAAMMTFALLASSLTMTLATRAQGRKQRLVWLAATLVLGLAFLGGTALEYAHLCGEAGMGLSSDLFASTFYALTGYHGLHVLCGVAALALMFRGSVTQRTLGVMSLYWHFVDLAWMPIFTFVYLLPAR